MGDIFEDEQICKHLVIAGENIGSYKGEICHLRIVTFMHGTFETHIDESIGERWMVNTMLNEGFHVYFDFCVDPRNCQDFLKHQVFIFQDILQWQLRVILVLVHFFKVI